MLATKKAYAEKTKTIKPGTIEHFRETYILKSLIPPDCLKSFVDICDLHQDILGKPGNERRKARNRREKLRKLQSNNYSSFKKYCSKFKLSCPDTLRECMAQQYPDYESEQEYSDEDESEFSIADSVRSNSFLNISSPEAKSMTPFKPKMILGSDTPTKDVVGK